jgi:thioredoxin-related protein
MKATFLFCVAALAAALHAKTSTPPGWLDDYDEALRQAAARGKPVLADFSGSDWCGWCIRLDREVFSTETFRAAATNDFVLLMVDMPQDASRLTAKAKASNPQLCRRYDVRGFPTVLALDEKGSVLFRTGYRPGGAEAYLKHLSSELARAKARPPAVKKGEK